MVFVEDIRRFPTAKHLVSYFNLNPAVNASGKQERRQKRKGKGHDHLSRSGRSNIKHLCSEIGQSMVRRDDCPIGKWARYKLATGKEYNKVCMAAARKVITCAWYILNGVPSPNRDIQAFCERKHGATSAEAGRETMTELGYPTRSSFVRAVSDEVFAHFAEKSSELRLASRRLWSRWLGSRSQLNSLCHEPKGF